MNRKIFKWEDLLVLGENKERGHAIAFSYDNKEDACKKKEVKTKYSLNGEWKFYYQMGTDLPENFAEKELNDTNWNILKERKFFFILEQQKRRSKSMSMANMLDTHRDP